MAHWLDSIAEVLKSPELNLRKLAEIGGRNPATAYRYCNLADCDLRGQDLRGIDFTGSNLDEARLDISTKIDDEFDPRIKGAQKFKFRVNRKLIKLINSEAYMMSYSYAVWFVKYALESIYQLRDSQDFKNTISQVINIDLSEYYTCAGRVEYVTRSVKVPIHIQKWFRENDSCYVLPEEHVSFMVFCFLVLRNRSLTMQDSVIFSLNNLQDRLDLFNNRKTGYISQF